MIGTLYIVSTPIGNLADITYRAVETLQDVAYILSEDPRMTLKVLTKYNISNKTQYKYVDASHSKIINNVIKDLESGLNIALVSDSGTPLISDPGFKLVNELRKRNLNVESIPGPSGVIAALTVSGLPTDSFMFLGFLPKSEKKIKDILNKYEELPATIVIYESPYRLLKTLTYIKESLPGRYISLCKDLTKKFEAVSTDTIENIADMVKSSMPKGEYIILIAKKDFNAN
jgi:16S rRNA (cytidine1402-2'-O)-methyltransferase